MPPPALPFAAALILTATYPLPSTTTPPPAPSAARAIPSPPSPLSTLTPASRGAVLRRAPFVYELPDGSIWDNFYYREFRRVLTLYDTTATSRPSVPAECRAWGFTATRRAPGKEGNRPHPLWHSLQARSPENLTPFIYIDSTSPTPHERKSPHHHATVGKRLGLNTYEVTIWEFPGGDLSLPNSFPLGYTTLPVLLPRQLNVKPGDHIKAEFFLIRDADTPPPQDTKVRTRPPARFVFAKDLRITPDRYAAALLDGRAQLIQWDWKRERTPTCDTYLWTHTVTPIETPTPTPAPTTD